MRNFPRPQSITLNHDRSLGGVSAQAYTRGCRCIHCFREKVIEYYRLELESEKARNFNLQEEVERLNRLVELRNQERRT